MVYQGMHCALYVLFCYSLILYRKQIVRLARSLFLPSTTVLMLLVNFQLPLQLQLARCRAVLLNCGYLHSGILPPPKGAMGWAGHCPGTGDETRLSRQAHLPRQRHPLNKESVGNCLSQFAWLSSFPLCFHTLVLTRQKICSRFSWSQWELCHQFQR